MDPYVSEAHIVVVWPKFIPHFGLWYKICETEEEVCQYDSCHFVERLNLGNEFNFKRLVPLQVDNHDQGKKVLNGKLSPQALLESKHDNYEGDSPEEEHDRPE